MSIATSDHRTAWLFDAAAWGNELRRTWTCIDSQPVISSQCVWSCTTDCSEPLVSFESTVLTGRRCWLFGTLFSAELRILRLESMR